MGYSVDLFFKKDGYESHVQVTGDDLLNFTLDLDTLVEKVKASGGEPRYARLETTEAKREPDPMERAAAKAFGATPVCVNGCKTPMRHVNGGISKRTNRPFHGFWACPTCESKVND